MAFIIDGSTGIATVDGSVSAPSQRGQDSNSGISYAADTIKFSTNGVERMAITNSGVTGINPGITHASTWYLTSSFTGSAVPVTALSAYTGAGAGTIGSAMTISSGIFTFPTTGIWYIQVDTGFQLDGDSRYNRAEIRTTTDNNTYNYAHSPYCFITDAGSSGNIYQNQHTGHLFDVVDTTNYKCRIQIEVQNSSTQTWMMKVAFIRYGDT
tara:strand:+ start:1519 stop:2151 length:633 start_codon:yes stop_codon:yes gene_type:complete